MNQQARQRDTQGEVLNQEEPLSSWHMEEFWLPSVEVFHNGPKSCPLGVWWRHHYIVTTNKIYQSVMTDSTSSPLPLPEIMWEDWKFQKSDHVVGSPGSQPLSLGGTKKSPSLRISMNWGQKTKYYPTSLLSWESPRVLGAMMMNMKLNILKFLIYIYVYIYIWSTEK